RTDGSAPLASGALSRGDKETGGRWWGAALPSGLKLEGGNTRYLLRVRSPLAIASVSDFRWLAATSQATGASTTTCAPHVRAGFGGAISRLISTNAGTDTEHAWLDAVFKLRTCNATTWYEDADNDGFGRADRTVLSCTKPQGHVATPGDCDDGNAARNPGAVDVCDGVDNDCDGTLDEADPDAGQACGTGGKGVCAAGTRRCVSRALACVANKSPSLETCNGEDDDCDGAVDEDNPGGGGSCTTSLPGPCAAGKLTCAAGKLQCVTTYKTGADVCDGIDNDCNGTVDDAKPAAHSCDDEDPCTLNVCAQGRCENPAGNDGASCNDLDACTTGDVCRAGICAGQVQPETGCGFAWGSPFTAAPLNLPA
ncbi:MAG: putative metal-binding motif-containing protein, partial [Myxococcales bacterium]